MVKSADLHLHTIFSDGTSTPEELVSQSKAKGLFCISVVDHDAVGGIERAAAAGGKEGIEVIPGIELSAEWQGLEIHMLGYFIDYKRPYLVEKLASLAQTRVERVYKIIDKLKEAGIDLEPESVFDMAEAGTVGRLHVARAMVKKRITSSTFEAFQKYLGERRPAYVCGFRFSPEDAIKLIKGVGGIPVLAHPYIIKHDELIPQLVACGLMGLEVYYPEHTQAMINYYLDLAKKHKLLVTGGSDFHGLAKPDVSIGMIKLDYKFIEKMKEAKNAA